MKWRIFPGLSYLKDDLGLITFLFLHLPLFYILLSEDIFYAPHFKLGFDYFLIIHLVLHLLFLFHPKNEFKDWISWVIIGAAALFGFLDIIMT